ncbi:hypothetical protein L202_03375 [Cryptococcus amylolentus CBS 6039]|uniref:GH16 domain-containing protein n=1 Tax=Cryptococcus amylolentus CBS 6039 TaxID=1295533 RepID=A0A1E3HV24_9TREE|nr:hypothetical protein L202_03375 [Cryptococcus amylolentus CBS 6039]ODN79371.1 hypothetical protein L202_03375 [Cryptococcus amylolentus CBS 6039]
MLTLLSVLLVITRVPQTKATIYPLVESWHGDGFFDGFRFPAETYDNTTNGYTFWATAQNTSLLRTTSSGTTILAVDNTSSVAYDSKRYAPKLLSKSLYDVGTVWVMDTVHMPYGCSVWPAFWTQGANWPEGGEIDIMEGINNQTTNVIALHTSNTTTCTVDSSSTSSFSGTVENNDCNNSLNSGAGCTVKDGDEKSYGAGFAEAGGGVYVGEYAEDGIRVWFITRADVPESLTADASSLDTSTLGTPVAEYLASTCEIDQAFSPQTLTINIALCGDFAGIPALLEQTCPALVGDATCYTTYVINDQSTTYAQAYFEINYINVFSSNPSSVTTIGSSPSSSSSASESVAENTWTGAKTTTTSDVKIGPSDVTTTVRSGGWTTNAVGVPVPNGISSGLMLDECRVAGSW